MFDKAKVMKEIEERNRIRIAAQLPPVDVTKELEKLEGYAEYAAFEDFYKTSPLTQQIKDRLIAESRKARNDPTWVPRGIFNGGLAIDTLARGEMREIYWQQGEHSS